MLDEFGYGRHSKLIVNRKPAITCDLRDAVEMLVQHQSWPTLPHEEAENGDDGIADSRAVKHPLPAAFGQFHDRRYY